MPMMNDSGGGAPAPAESLLSLFGFGSPPPAPPTAPPTLGNAPVVSSTPQPGQGVALDPSGALPVTVSLLGVVATDPISPVVGQFWFRAGSLCVRSAIATTVRVALS